MESRDAIAGRTAVMVLATAILLIGGAHRWPACASAALAIACTVPYWTSRRELSEPGPLLWLLGTATGASLLQLVPLPAVAVEVLSPARHALALDNASALGIEAPVLIPLSYDPPATWLELAKLTGYIAFAYTVMRLSCSTRGKRWISTVLGACGPALALIALGHEAFGAAAVFGLYEPKQATGTTLMAPLLNTNHLGSFFAFSTPIVLAHALAARGGTRALWIAGLLAVLGALLLTESRGAVLALLVGLTVLGGCEALRRRRAHKTQKAQLPLDVAVPIGLIFVCAITLLLVFTASGTARELISTTAGELKEPTSKYEAWRASSELIADTPWAGAGRGAFEEAFTRYQPASGITYSHLENQYLQIVVDWGIPVTIILALAMAATLLAAFAAARRGVIEAGIFAGTVALGAQSFFDFGLELPGVAFPATAALAILTATRLRRVRAEQIRRQRTLRVALSVFGMVAVIIAASPVGRPAEADAEALDELLADDHPTLQDAVEAASRVWTRHPADYFTAGVLTRKAARDQDPRTVRLLNRALFLNPRHSGLHHLAAQVLTRAQRPEQAMVEYRLALANLHRADPAPIVANLLHAFPDLDGTSTALPHDPATGAAIAAALMGLERHDIALVYARRLLNAAPNDPELLRLAGRAALVEREFDSALTQARKLQSVRPSLDAFLLEVWALRGAGELNSAHDILIERLDSADHPAQQMRLLPILAEIQIDLNQFHSARGTLERLQLLAVNDTAAMARTHRLFAMLEKRLNHPHQEAWHLRHAESFEARD